ncbi:Deoxyribodipyrimidine photo-lyase [Rhodovastum atsumiense]|uniref:cryptochrome/photolyase family protein n=1 Tax=Rhodovastum atsumiense TaxID=504468 RepID=UPI00193B3DEF|nr:deoxyribodipyrimidine photo-lyase [Rhodovastum atsumiense]CAH2599205.1 Deoxyribodipyrimidine photo-lyase [Rhodovastum atsumiense]
MTSPVLLWLHRELRLGDNRALLAAVASGQPVLPIFVLDDETPGAWRPGEASRWWLHHSLAALAADLARLGAPLLLRRGRIADILPSLVRETGASAIHAGQPVEPWARRVAAELPRLAGVPLVLHRTVTLFDPEALRSGAGTPYAVFTPFSKACLARGPAAPPLPAPAHILAPERVPPSDPLEAWGLLPGQPDWAGGLRGTWTPGEAGARQRLAGFLDHTMEAYATARDRPDMDGTSRLSPHLHFGEISADQLWHAARAAGDGPGQIAFIREILWREFSAHLLWHHPTLPETPLRPNFARMPWQTAPRALRAWQRGRTGLPIVDAGMRQLWQTGWMHNRVRMIVASLLVKHLMLPWQQGEAWFWDTLVDADLANNAASWQWVAGCGADAAPFFRIFNPVLQGRKFDPDGSYVRRFVPELARLPDRWIHEPWAAPADVLEAARLRPGITYPAPIVDLAAGRARALAAFASLSAT